MANYTLRADGTAANKAAAEDGDPSVASECMSIATHNSQTFSAGDRIQLADDGGDYRGTRLDAPSSGSVGSPIVYEAYSGDTPILNGSTDVTSASYKWTASGSGTNEYYLEAAAGGDPSLTREPDQAFMDGVFLTIGTVGSLADHEWDWGDNDSLGFSTVYVRDESGDPDVSGVQIEVDQNACMYVYGKDYITVDGLTFKHAHIVDYIGGFMCSGDAQHVIVQNCEAHYCNGHGIMIKGDYCTIDNCVAANCGAHGLGAGGFLGNHSTNMVVKNSTAYNTRTIGYVGQDPYDGYGIKFLWCDDSDIHNCEAYGCNLEGINLDGSLNDEEGCLRCDVYENDVHNNMQQGILVELFSDDCRLFRNRVYDNQEYSGTPPGEIGLTNVEGTEVFGNVIYRTEAAGGANAKALYIIDYNPGRGNACNTLIYGNTFDGGGYWQHVVVADGYDIVEGMQVFNNVFSDFTGYALALTGQDYTGFDADYNVYQADDANATVIIYESFNTYTVVTGGTGTWYTSAGFGENSKNAAPNFTNKGSQNFELASNSPAVNSGTDLGSPYNEAVMPGSSWPDGVVTGDQGDY